MASITKEEMQEVLDELERDFPEDFDQENGRYMNTCISCRKTFQGNKHRITCKVCTNKKKLPT